MQIYPDGKHHLSAGNLHTESDNDSDEEKEVEEEVEEKVTFPKGLMDTQEKLGKFTKNNLILT